MSKVRLSQQIYDQELAGQGLCRAYSTETVINDGVCKPIYREITVAVDGHNSITPWWKRSKSKRAAAKKTK